MKRSQKFKVLAVLLVLAGLVLAFAWLIASLAMGVELRMNGPWLIAVLSCGLGAAFAFASILAEENERKAEIAEGRRLVSTVSTFDATHPEKYGEGDTWFRVDGEQNIVGVWIHDGRGWRIPRVGG